MTKGTEVLRAEHKGIEKMLKIIEICANRHKAVDFFINFADHCHHRKEESFLFPLLIQKDSPSEGGLIATLLLEHEQGRKFVRSMASSLDNIAGGRIGAISSLSDAIYAYSSLLKAHIEKENNILFKMAEQVSTKDEQLDLYDKFEILEREEIGEGVHEKYHHLIHELASKFGLAD